MAIVHVSGKAARAKLSCIRFAKPVTEVAIQLAEWQERQSPLIVPHRVELSHLPAASDFVARAATVRKALAERLQLDPSKASRISFLLFGRHAWCLGPRTGEETTAPMAAIEAAPERYLQLMLTQALLERGAYDRRQTFVTEAFGSSAYIGATGSLGSRFLHLFEVDYRVNGKHQQLICDLHTRVFRRKSDSESSVAGAAVDANEGMLASIARLAASDFRRLDAREYPIRGVSLSKRTLRQSRLYFLNLLTEYSIDYLVSAGIRCEQDFFEATHCVEGGFVPLEPLAELQRPLALASTEAIPDSALRPLQQFAQYFPSYHTAGGKKTTFRPFDVRRSATVEAELDVNLLFLSPIAADDESSVGVDGETATIVEAYSALSEGGDADAYTRLKYERVINRSGFESVIQGINISPAALSNLQPTSEVDEDRQLRESVKRCLVEVALKECLAKIRPVPLPNMPADLQPRSLTLLATRSLRGPRGTEKKSLVSAVDVAVELEGVYISRVRRTPWSSPSAALEFAIEFPFLLRAPDKPMEDNQFWIVDSETGDRLRVWTGGFIPRILLNANHETIEAALAAHDDVLGAEQTKYFSKDRDFNLLPYYMGFFKSEYRPRSERAGQRIALQDRGSFLRVFVPPAEGLQGAGDALSGMRDLMVYRRDGQEVQTALAEHTLARIYLHTMTNGILVAGDNSKMSVLEKLAKLAILN